MHKSNQNVLEDYLDQLSKCSSNLHEEETSYLIRIAIESYEKYNFKQMDEHRENMIKVISKSERILRGEHSIIKIFLAQNLIMYATAFKVMAGHSDYAEFNKKLIELVTTVEKL